MKSSRPGVLRTIESQLDPKHTALVVVDVQNDFVHPEGFYGRRSGKLWSDGPSFPIMLDRLPHLVEAARKADCLIVFVRWMGDPQRISDSLNFLQERDDMYGDLCIPGTFGADFYGDIRPRDSSREVVVTKYRYSGFAGTDLDLILRSSGIKTVVTTGAVTCGCVESTARDAFSADYYLVVAGDACADLTDARHQASLAILGSAFGTVVQVEDLVNIWSRSTTLSAREPAPIARSA